MSEKKYDLIIIGGGPGGYVAAIRASQLKMSVMVIEKENLGGICLNWGCIPTKALLKNAEVYEAVKTASNYGIKCKEIEVDFPKIIKKSRTVANNLSKGVGYLFKNKNVDWVNAYAKLIDNHTVETFDDSGKEIERYTADNIIIATGGRPKTIPGIEIDGERIISSREALSLDKMPKSLTVIGAGAIGIEFGYFYSMFGCSVNVVEMMPSILPLEDREITDVLAKSLKRKKMKLYTDTKVKGIALMDGSVDVTVVSPKGESVLSSEKVLMAIGVTGNIENLGLEELGIINEAGFIKVDKDYKTNVDNVYAIGDVIGAPLLAHMASAEGINAVEKINGGCDWDVDYDNVPGCTYCKPQVASVGLTEERAKAKGYELKIGRFPFSALGKAMAIGEREGLVKLIFDAKTKKLLGAHLVGPEVTELLAELGLAKSSDLTYTSIHRTVHAHPTLSEAIMEAASDVIGEAIHV